MAHPCARSWSRTIEDGRPPAARTARGWIRPPAAALEHTGGGTVLEAEAEAGDDGAAYGVEIRLDGGSVVGVVLDENFHVVGESEDEGASEQGAAEQIGKDED